MQQLTLLGSLNPDGTLNLDYSDGTGLPSLDPTGFFGLGEFNPSQIIRNLRMTLLLGPYSDPRTQEFLARVNGAGAGIHCTDTDYALAGIALAADGTYTLEFGPDLSTIAQTITGVDPFDLTQTKQDREGDAVILDNIKADLRLAGYTDFTASVEGKTALEYLATRTYWY